MHTCALTIYLRVMCWGYNYNGQLGIGNNQNQYSPVSVVLSSGTQTKVQLREHSRKEQTPFASLMMHQIITTASAD